MTCMFHRGIGKVIAAMLCYASTVVATLYTTATTVARRKEMSKLTPHHCILIFVYMLQ
jgi:hypothetical protein